jgi:hypothetical protein
MQCLGTFVYTSAKSNELGRIYFADFLPYDCSPYAQSFLRKPSFLVLADFLPWFLKSKQLLGFLGFVCMLE